MSARRSGFKAWAKALPARTRRAGRLLGVALGLLTVIPLLRSVPHERGDSGRAAGWYPLVGVLVGALVAAVHHGAALVFPPWVAAVLATVAWVGLSGALHLDGLADCCDGLLHQSDPERRRAIMKDPHVGTFGTAGVVLVLLAKVGLLASFEPGQSWLPLMLAASLGRWAILPAARQALASPTGMGADFAAGLSGVSLVLGALVPLALAVLVGPIGFLAGGLGLLLGLGLVVLARRRIGGVSGDVFGCLVELVETATLMGCFL